MHARAIVQRFIETHLTCIHAARRTVLSAAVGALMQGSPLSLSRLARGVIGETGLKAALKRIDRLIGHRRIEAEAKGVAAAIIERMKRAGTLVIAIDWSAIGPGGKFVELRAALTLPGEGRGITLYQQIYPLSKLGNPKAEGALLDALHHWIGNEVRVIVITDAGFRRAWFAHLERLKWAWIGRMRGNARLASRASGRWCWAGAGTWFTKASGKAQRWIDCRLTRKAALPCDVVLVRRQRMKRKHYRCPGHGSTPKASREARGAAREPWLLVHSAQLRAYRPDEIVTFYAQRMQIEENFRDNKSTFYGMGQEMSRSRSALRLHALSMIATLAAFLMWHIGQWAEAEGAHRRFKATTRTARELSIITLARLLCALPALPLTETAIKALYLRLGV
jgi:DDE family transposase